MAHAHLLAAPDSLVDSIESVLDARSIIHRRKSESTLRHGRHTFDLIELTCQSGHGAVALAIEKRHGRTGAYITLVPVPRWVFWRNQESELLAERLLQLLREQGADDSPDMRCEDME